MKSLEPQAIVLPASNMKRCVASAVTVVDLSVYCSALFCHQCGRLAELNACYCGYCGLRLRESIFPHSDK